MLTLTSDPDLRIAARLDIGWSLLWSGRNADALETLIAVAAEASPRSPTLAWDATGLAATVAYQTGCPKPAPRHVPPWTVSTPRASRCRQPKTGRPSAAVTGSPRASRASRAARALAHASGSPVW